MISSLVNIASKKIPLDAKLDFRSETVLKNIHSHINREIVKLTEKKEQKKEEYSLINNMYYDELMSESTDADVFDCVDEMSQRHNAIIDLRNQFSFLKLWSPNYVKMDLAISKYIAWPSTTAEKQEIFTMFYGILSHHKEIVLKDPTDMEIRLMAMINEYIARCTYWYTGFNVEVDEKRIISIADTLRQNADDTREINSTIRDFRDVYEHLSTILETQEMDELWLDLVNLIDLNNNV